MAVELIDEEDQGPAEEKAQVPPPPAIDKDALARQIAAEIRNDFLRAGQQQQQQMQPSAVEAVVKEMIDDGFDPRAVRSILRLQAAKELEQGRAMSKRQAEQAVESYSDACWAMAEEALGSYESVFPVFAKNQPIRKAVLEMASDIFATDKEFDDQKMRAERGQLPTKESFKRAMAKAVDVYCKENGIAKKQAEQLDLRVSKPEPQRSSSEDAYSQLDAAQRKYFDALRSARAGDGRVFDEKEALKRALRFKKG